ncbi:NAD-dependent epimerase/dehydratase family protein, partial [Candidatus Bathyarchaeota archaeon]|nr:NAD-dependent epimerase/dehydratase family protein [Candidatus Bathyarchaeota archaeon]
MEKRKMIRSLVTGGKGFIGSYLVNYLKEHGHWVRSVDIKPQSYLETKEDEFCLVDLRDFSNALRVIKHIDYVWNLAANMGGIVFITSVGA